MSHSAFISLISLFFSVPFWQPPKWKHPLTQQPIGPKRQRGEKRPEIHSFISIPFLLLVFLPLPLASLLSFLFFSSRFLVLCFGRIAMARFGFLSLALFSLQALIGTGFAAVCLYRFSFRFVNCFANVILLLIRTLRRTREKERKHQS